MCRLWSLKVCSQRLIPFYLDGQKGYTTHSVHSITVPVKKIEGAARQSYGDSDGIVRCEQIFTRGGTCNILVNAGSNWGQGFLEQGVGGHLIKPTL